MSRRAGACAGLALAAAVLLACPVPAEAALLRSLAYLIGGVVEIPRAILAGTVSGPPVLGTALGAVNGTFRSAAYLSRSALELAGTAVPLARGLGPFLLPFLF